MYSREKTKWLNILHAGWPGGLVVGGLMTLALGEQTSWQVKVGLVFIPIVIYGIMLFGQRFPVHERVAAGVSYQAMLKEVGIVGALIIVSLMTFEIGNTFQFAELGKLTLGETDIPYLNIAIIVLVVGAFGAYVRSLGNPLFIFLLFIMMPLATTELGTDTWISDLMKAEMDQLSMQAGWVLVYTSFIMMVLRFFAGPIVHALSPLGLLAVSAAVAACGLTALSFSAGVGILLAATLYGLGKTFFWPTMLGVVAERFPQGGAMTINTIAGVGMLSVGIVGSVFLGFVQDKATGNNLQAHDEQHSTQLYSHYMGEEKASIFGTYRALDQEKIKTASADEQTVIAKITSDSKKSALRTVAVLPVIMFVCYITLIIYFRSQGGYKPVHLESQNAAGSA
jgi:MFS family permease